MVENNSDLETLSTEAAIALLEAIRDRVNGYSPDGVRSLAEAYKLVLDAIRT